MSPIRIFVSYTLSTDPRETEIIDSLVSDLRASGAEVVTENGRIADKDFTPFLTRPLTPASFQNWSEAAGSIPAPTNALPLSPDRASWHTASTVFRVT